MRIDRRETYRDESMRVVHDGELFTGELETKDADGNLIALGNYYEGVQHGLQEQWFPNGRKKAEGVVDFGVAVHEWRRWYPDGTPAQVRTFDAAGRQLHITRWDKDGTLVEDKDLTTS
ncbi:toxin-antitoxin system YwqK family antitoxin [Saccharothrix obliqua]|uniref:toxin-antitoxin system YwqK family antitoxin n=1 Tax=Saccharothrix obliqua TaxID=2861747 RepID=UPI001C5DFED9|nr:hypothetical protein [Saccharothrix obliqua]MBW4719901.1 hypothetical protein [Saccharothrix obliqua]